MIDEKNPMDKNSDSSKDFNTINKIVKANSKGWSDYAKYSSIGIQMVGYVLIFILIGYGLDYFFKTSKPYFTAGFGLLGSGVSVYALIRAFNGHK